MQYLVIIKVPDAPDMGNLAIPMYDTYVETVQPSVENNFTGQYHSLFEQTGLGIILMRQEVFRAGEILITEDGERECVGAGRKPSKWSVEYECLDNIEDAVTLSKTICGMEGL